MPPLLCYIDGIYTSVAKGCIIQGDRTRAINPWFRLNILWRRSQWPRILMRGSAPARFLGLRVRILSGAWMFCLLWTLCVLMDKSLRRADHSSRGFLPNIVCLSVIRCNNNFFSHNEWGTRWRSWFRRWVASRKVAGSNPDDVTGIFHWHNPSGRTMALELTQPPTEISTRNISWEAKVAGA